MTRPLIVFAHGAGAPSGHPWMKAWAERLRTLGEVHTFDYPYVKAGRKAPDRQATLVNAHAQAIAEIRAGADDNAPLVLAGKSMGSRIGCHVAAEASLTVAALVCFGFPLGVGARAEARTRVLLALETPVLFVQGDRDPLCPLDGLEAVRQRMSAPTRLHVVADGNHSLEVTKRALARSGRTQDDCDRAALAAVADFLNEFVVPRGRDAGDQGLAAGHEKGY